MSTMGTWSLLLTCNIATREDFCDGACICRQSRCAGLAGHVHARAQKTVCQANICELFFFLHPLDGTGKCEHVLSRNLNIRKCYKESSLRQETTVESSQRKTTVVYIAKTWSKNDRCSWLRAQCPDFLNK